MQNDDTANDATWRKLFKVHRALSIITSIGYYDIISQQMNTYREARLLAKIDRREDLPKIMKRNRWRF